MFIAEKSKFLSHWQFSILKRQIKNQLVFCMQCHLTLHTKRVTTTLQTLGWPPPLHHLSVLIVNKKLLLQIRDRPRNSSKITLYTSSRRRRRRRAADYPEIIEEGQSYVNPSVLFAVVVSCMQCHEKTIVHEIRESWLFSHLCIRDSRPQ